jgi:hypothetical protein
VSDKVLKAIEKREKLTRGEPEPKKPKKEQPAEEAPAKAEDGG